MLNPSRGVLRAVFGVAVVAASLAYGWMSIRTLGLWSPIAAEWQTLEGVRLEAGAPDEEGFRVDPASLPVALLTWARDPEGPRWVDGLPGPIASARFRNALVGLAGGWILLLAGWRFAGPLVGLVAMVLFWALPETMAWSRLATTDLIRALLVATLVLVGLPLLHRASARVGRILGTALLAGLAFWIGPAGLIPIFFLTLTAGLLSLWPSRWRVVYRHEPLDHSGDQMTRTEILRQARDAEANLRRELDQDQPEVFESAGWKAGLRIAIVLGLAFLSVHAVNGFERSASMWSEHPSFAGLERRVEQRLPFATSWLGWLGPRVPAPLPDPILEDLARTEKLEPWVTFRNQRRRGGWWWTLPLLLLVRTPVPVLILVFAAMALLFLQRRQLHHEWWSVLAFLLWSLVLLAVFDGTGKARSLLLCQPFLALLAARAVAAPFAPSQAPSSRQLALRRGLAQAAAVGLLLASLGSAFQAYPHPLAFVNRVAGGSDAALEWLGARNCDLGQDLGLVERAALERGFERYGCAVSDRDSPLVMPAGAQRLRPESSDPLPDLPLFISASLLWGPGILNGPWLHLLERDPDERITPVMHLYLPPHEQ